MFASVVFDERTLIDAAVVRFVMLESEVRDVVAEGQQKVVVGVMPRAKQDSGLLDEVAVMFPDFVGSVERSGTVGGEVEFRGRVFVGRSQWHDLQIFSG